MSLTSKGAMREPYKLTTKDGITLSFGSRLEAQAALIRAGGGRIFPVKKKDGLK